MTQNPHMKKKTDLREQEMLMNLRSKRLCLKITSTARNGNCGSPSPQTHLPPQPRAPSTRNVRAPLELEPQSVCLCISQSN